MNPAEVAALLDQLRASSAWQHIVSAQSEQQAQLPKVAGTSGPAEISDQPQPSVAELLAQLKTPGATSGPSLTPLASRSGLGLPPPSPVTTGSSFEPYPYEYHPVEPSPQPRSYTFQEALPLLSRLGEDPVFVATIKRLRQDQDNLERQLLADRQAIQDKYAEKIKLAKTKAAMIGAAGISKHDATMIQLAYQREIHKFDKERVLPAWDALALRQQSQLESLGVPNMHESSDPREKERQKKIIDVVVGLTGEDI